MQLCDSQPMWGVCIYTNGKPMQHRFCFSTTAIASFRILFFGLFASALDAAEPAVGVVYDAPGTHIVPPLSYGGDPAYTSFTALRARSTANIIAEELRLQVSVENWSNVLHATGLEAFDNSSITFSPATSDAHINFRVTSYHYATGLIAADQSIVDFRGNAIVEGMSWGDAVFAKVRDEGELLLGGRVTLEQDSNAEALGIDLADDAKFYLTGRLDVTDRGNDSAVGIRARGRSQSRLLGESRVSDAGNADAILIDLREESTAFVGGKVQIADEGNGNAVIIDASGSSYSLFAGIGSVKNQGNGKAIGVRAAGQSVVDFRGNYSLIETGSGQSILFDLRDHARVNFQGVLKAESSGNGNSAALISLANNASLHFSAGLLENRSRVLNLALSGASTMVWSGGQISSGSEGGMQTPSFVLNDSSTLKIRVRFASLPLGRVQNTQGPITGVLWDGSPFAMNYVRSESATIVLVPEPIMGKFVLAIWWGWICIKRPTSRRAPLACRQ